MLTTRKNVTLNGQSSFDGKVAAQFIANIDSQNPEDMTINRYMSDKEEYKAHRTAINTEYVEFEDMAYALQEEMLRTNESAE